FNVIRARAARNQPAPPAPPETPAPTVATTKPYFSLTTNRTYSPNESSRVWASYQNIDHLDFRVYRVKDPNKFFKQLDDPHQMGEKEKDGREPLPALEKEYDSRMVTLGKQEPGVYLIEAVNGDLRAYSIAIVSNLTMIEKTTKDGQVLVYVVDRKTGAPHEGVSIEVTKSKQVLASGTTDKTGVFKTEVKQPAAKEGAEENADEEESKKS